jgi:hypothetical protein
MSTTDAASVSVVVAAHRPGPALDACLAAYARELRPGDELIIGMAADDAACAAVRAVHADAVVLPLGRRALTPELWAAGLHRARGELVRLTIQPCVPIQDWRSALVRAHAGGLTAVGGAIVPGTALRWRDWAVFLLRYRSFVPPFARRPVRDVPGDHASYVRSALDSSARQWRLGFWEYEINHVLVAEGAAMAIDPAMVAVYEGGDGAWRFFKQRFRHGVRFGRSRLRPGWNLRRFIYAAAFVLPGAVFLVKIVRSVLRTPRLRSQLAWSSGWLMWYLAAWSLGEWVGAVRGALPSAAWAATGESVAIAPPTAERGQP